MGYRYPFEPSGISEEGEKEHLEEFVEEMHKAHEADAAEHHAHRFGLPILGGILALAGVALTVLAVISPNYAYGPYLVLVGIALALAGCLIALLPMRTKT